MNMECRLDMQPDPLTRSIFPRVDEALDETDNQKALAFVGAKKDMSRYRSLVDFLFCEIFIEYRAGCFRYYDDLGPQLKEILNEQQTLWFEKALFQALEIAREKFEAHLALTWTKFRVEVLRRVA